MSVYHEIIKIIVFCVVSAVIIVIGVIRFNRGTPKIKNKKGRKEVLQCK